ncbi:hypothetical protein AGABI1DRAFT_80803 [Agaricus bisporus var. burnettii JB137-S8]|uniref:Chromatin modification-related protein EAF3 n=2 Tax=Agaricus bisporus var. burnettii TaxID=192524 RepID=K5XJP3_AGABU|nr:hypothetical protein AGABI2DRAFT_196009 [Agaricus bisporus var. bisporus H97]XP_007334661.1 uncharacterized protein AGABI1DRAFT_80803 [Agaricus bisporus var. burnettii JB137-S8]EKM74705.1 hypothetical protein AGABI1DRAFT_80803 [Agaricus bisporus var. burnettii JB137-S8]EKV42312.1 hypothetical protein AGABI2DRAFT_196009 [Agaricus bisporus var. bisporus H97]KAF7760831.1 hypothetical protein Agabi119p4_10240 [Agaricus bisporus var. burnettii]
MSSPAEVSYDLNERVLCYHGPLIYEAKVLKPMLNYDETNAPTGIPGPHYFVHYKGWKQTWDEWVPSNRLLKHNEQNIALQKSLQATALPHTGHGGSASSSARAHHGAGTKGSGTRTGARKDGGRGTKRGREEDDANKKPDMKMNVPDTLKVVLVDDWEAITKNNQLVSLPRSPNVQELLEEWLDYMLKLEPKPPHLREPKLVLPTIVSGLTCYFDRSLGANLLYRFERPQYASVRKQYITGSHVIVGQEKEMSQVYGAEHFLRMLVSLPQMIACSTLDTESVYLIRDYVNELLVWMGNEREHLFLAEYPSASLPYQNVSRS